DQRLPVHRQFLRMACRHPFRICFIDHANNGKMLRYAEVLAGALILSRRLKPVLGDAPLVGVWLPPSVGGAFANIALALLGKAPVNLNYTASPQVVQSAARQCNLRHVLTSKLFTSKMPLDAGPEVQIVNLEEFRKDVTTAERVKAIAAVVLLPHFVLERWVF